MKKKPTFVFQSSGRWRKVKLLLLALALTLAVFSAAVFAALTTSFDPDFSPKNTLPIIDEISTKVPDKIEIAGEGPVISIKADNGHYLERTTPPLEKIVFLTFDDGPDPVFTQPILDVLEKQGAKATFFAIGENLYKYPNIVKDIAKSGSLIANHTFSHTPEEQELYGQSARMYFEFELTQRFIEDLTGYSTDIFRIPYGGTDEAVSMNNLVLAANAKQRGYKIVGSTIDSGDWQNKTAQEIAGAVISQNEKSAALPVILLHDGGGNRQNTISALPQIIAFYKEQGYRFETVDKLFPGETTIIPINTLEKIYAKSAVTLYKIIRNIPQITSSVFIFGLFTFGIHSILISTFAILHKIREKRRVVNLGKYQPKVSIIIPAFNEEKVIEKTLKAALAQDYPDFEVIVVNDGSSDKTQKKLSKFLENEKVILLWQANLGKYAALNTGIAQASGKILVVIDADTQIIPQTLVYLVTHFKNRKVAAVSGNVKVGNQKSLLSFLQEIDYRTSLNLERRAFDFLNSIFVVPGALGAWRKSAVVKVGGFSPATITEDAELGLRLRKAGYRVVYESKAVALTEVPITVRSLVRQRFRWTFGILQTLWLHKDMNFKPRHGILGMLILPYIIFIQIPSMAMATVIELAAIPIAIFVSLELVLASAAALLIGRFLIFTLASVLAEEDLSLVPYIIPYRFAYQFLWYFVLDIAIITAIKGVYVSWQKLPHFGLVESIVPPSLVTAK